MQNKFLRALLFGALALPLLGQSDVARMVGTITDPSGALIPGASVAVQDEKTTQERKVTSDAAGYFVIPAFGVFNSTVSKDVGLGAQRQVQLSLRLNF